MGPTKETMCGHCLHVGKMWEQAEEGRRKTERLLGSTQGQQPGLLHSCSAHKGPKQREGSCAAAPPETLPHVTKKEGTNMVWGATTARGQWPTSVNLSQQLPRVVGLITSISERKETKSSVTQPVSQTMASECLSP